MAPVLCGRRAIPEFRIQMPETAMLHPVGSDGPIQPTKAPHTEFLTLPCGVGGDDVPLAVRMLEAAAVVAVMSFSSVGQAVCPGVGTIALSAPIAGCDCSYTERFSGPRRQYMVNRRVS